MKNSIILARYGGLSPVKQTHYQKKEEEMNFHSPPEKYGFYAFIFPYIDWFLLSGTDKLKEGKFKNKRKRLTQKYRKFQVSGPIWTHMDIPPKLNAFILDKKGYWTKIDFIYLEEILKYNKKEEKKYLFSLSGVKKNIPLSCNVYNFINTDHLEIFVPKGTKIKG